MGIREVCAVFDIGGTKILAGFITASGTLIAKRRIETLPERGAEDIVARVAALLRELAGHSDISWSAVRAVGCSVPGPLDAGRGVVLFSPNLDWRDVPLVELVQRRLDVPVAIEDDARCAALGEAAFGAAHDAKNALYVTVSTGIGAGVIVDGQIYRGAHGFAGEIGHMTIVAAGPPCACGNFGCLEALSSGTAIATHARQVLRHGDETVLRTFVSDPALLTAEQVAQAAQAGDALAAHIMETAGHYLGIGLAAAASVIDPEVIVLGGAVAQPESIFVRAAREMFARRAITPLGGLIRLVPAMLGDESGLWGAFALVKSAGFGSAEM